LSLSKFPWLVKFFLRWKHWNVQYASKKESKDLSRG
jgi:hypothetical protein